MIIIPGFLLQVEKWDSALWINKKRHSGTYRTKKGCNMGMAFGRPLEESWILLIKSAGQFMGFT